MADLVVSVGCCSFVRKEFRRCGWEMMSGEWVRVLRSVEPEFPRERRAGDHVILHLKIGKEVVVGYLVSPNYLLRLLGSLDRDHGHDLSLDFRHLGHNQA